MKRCFAGFLLLIFSLSLFACSSHDDADSEHKNAGKATLSAVGDIFLTDSMLADARQPDGSYSFAKQFVDVIVPLSEADITIGNFEGNFTGMNYSAADGSYPDALASELYTIGFDLLQTANSYSIYNGLNGLERTKSVIESSGMKALGTYVDEKDKASNQVIIREANGIRFAFIAFTKGVGGLSIPQDTQCSVDLLYKDYTSDYSEVDTSYITGVIDAAHDADPDVIIAALHWGSENISEISETQEEITSLLLNNGVDVILGSHSHLVGEVEQRTVTMENGKKRDCVIAYSLGDFCAVDEGECNTSIILQLEFTRNESDAVEITDISYTPVSAVDRGDAYADRYCVVSTEAAIQLYESNYYDHLPTAVYEVMVSDLERINKKLQPET